MKTAIIACATLKAELQAVMNLLGCRYPVFWLEAGDHNQPPRRREEILHMLDRCREFDTLLLVMAFCGGALEGVSSSSSTLVLPRFDDCISLLLGEEERRSVLKGHYFLTRGWMDGKDSLANEYRRSLSRYGEASTKRIFTAMLNNYSCLAYLDTGVEDAPDIREEIAQMSRTLGLENRTIRGTLRNLSDLISGNHDPKRFLVVPPGTVITREMVHRERSGAQ